MAKKQNEKEKCIMKGCPDPRYKDKLMCEYHWKRRRQQDWYRGDEY